jgi:hypothetical protein
VTTVKFDTHLAPPLTDAERDRRDALLMLDSIKDYSSSHEFMLSELSFNYGYSMTEAARIYNDWLRGTAMNTQEWWRDCYADFKSGDRVMRIESRAQMLEVRREAALERRIAALERRLSKLRAVAHNAVGLVGSATTQKINSRRMTG